MTVRACPPLVKPVWRTGTEGLFTVFLSARPVRGERSHEPRARASDRAPETIDRALVVDASNATMAGDGFVPNRGALYAAADAARSMWWWDAPSEAWRTRRARMDAASGTKSAVSGADVDDWVPWAELLDASEAPYFRWFHGARTNACFNAVDRHCLEGRGDDCAMAILPEEVTPPTLASTSPVASSWRRRRRREGAPATRTASDLATVSSSTCPRTPPTARTCSPASASASPTPPPPRTASRTSSRLASPTSVRPSSSPTTLPFSTAAYRSTAPRSSAEPPRPTSLSTRLARGRPGPRISLAGPP